MNEHLVSIEAEIAQLTMQRPHVVLLGAGASRQAFPNGEASGRRLPLMNDFSEIVSVADVLKRAGISYLGRNFEEIYSGLSERVQVREELERVVFDYFSMLKLPPEPTVYDSLVLCMREKDVIATFNWDPFLIQAIRRTLVPQAIRSPKILFLHGNVGAGYCEQDRVHGVRGNKCTRCGTPFGASQLLYPTLAKDYTSNQSIADAWRAAKSAFKSAFMVTVFGYGAPESDVAAMELLHGAWGGPDKRSMEQFEIIDVREEDDLVRAWSGFIHSHHYEIHKDVFDSWLFKHPRRTGEAYLNQYVDTKFIEDHRIPQMSNLEELWTWFQPLLEREKAGVA